MSAKIHLHMHVSDLARSRAFYEKFLGGDPVKVKPGYVKFLPDWAPVNLALSGGGAAAEGTVNHVGIQVDAVATVMAHLDRVKAAGLPVRGREHPRRAPGPGDGGLPGGAFSGARAGVDARRRGHPSGRICARVLRLGRQRLVRLAMLSCAMCAAGIGFLGSRSYPLAAVLVLAYGLLIWLDSSSLTAGAAGSADPRRRGATLALHSMAGYAGGFVGPIVIGWILDLGGGMSAVSWGFAFMHIAVIGLIGRFAFVALAPRDLVGDRSGR